MSDPERLKILLAEAKNQVEQMDPWMKTQEPAPGDSYEDWICTSEETIASVNPPTAFVL